LFFAGWELELSFMLAVQMLCCLSHTPGLFALGFLFFGPGQLGLQSLYLCFLCSWNDGYNRHAILLVGVGSY
jgi:hypothetical protein